MLSEIASEVGHMITHDWSHLLIELIQFAILVAIVKFVAFGFGKRRGVIVGMLADRRERVHEQLATAAQQEQSAADAPQRIREIGAQADVQREQIIEQAFQTAAAERERIQAETSAQITQLEEQTEQTLEHERAEVLSGVRDLLLDIVARGTRQVLDEGYSATQQRDMIQAAIVDSIEDLGNVRLS